LTPYGNQLSLDLNNKILTLKSEEFLKGSRDTWKLPEKEAVRK
jgi:hypothetical protein